MKCSLCDHLAVVEFNHKRYCSDCLTGMKKQLEMGGALQVLIDDTDQVTKLLEKILGRSMIRPQ